MTKKKNYYTTLLIPLDKPFYELSKDEAREYFEWFISNIDERSDYLRAKVSDNLNVPIDCLDFSLDSLKIIWKWFLQVAEVSKTSKRALKKLKKSLIGQSKSFINNFLKQCENELSSDTEYILRDIGMYLARIFVGNYSCLKWTIRYTSESYVYVNVPLITGFVDDNPNYPKPFSLELEPIELARISAMNLFDNTQNENDLYNRCLQWSKLISKT